MSHLAIRVVGLSKQYRIGSVGDTHKTLRDDLMNAFSSFWQRTSERLRGQRRDEADRKQLIWALKDLSFEVELGEVVGLIGHNGAGKSTLLKILSSITEPTAGEVELYGRVGSLLEVGTGFHPELTGRENIYLNGAILGMTRREINQKFDEIVAFSEVERFIDTPVKRYSSGMYMRLAFAVAAHLDPEILVIDEVLAVGDVAFQKKCLNKMKEVSEAGRTVVFVSHNLAAVQRLCPRTILLEKGRQAMSGPTDEVITHYLRQRAVEESTSVELPAHSPDAPGSAKRLSFFASDGKPKSQFRLGEVWYIVVEFELFRALPHVMATVQLITLQSVSLITYCSKAKDLKAGRYRVKFLCDTPLKHGDLQFTVALSSHERNFYAAQEVGHLSITPVMVSGKAIRVNEQDLLFSYQESEIEALIGARHATFESVEHLTAMHFSYNGTLLV